MILRAASRIVDGLGGALFVFVAISILISMVAGTADVLSIRLLVRTVPGAVEFAQNLMPIIVFGALVFIQREGQHIRVEFIYDRLGARGRAVLDLLNSIFVTLASAALAFVSWQGFLRSNAIKEAGMAFPFPIYPVKFFIVVGLVAMAAKMVVEVLVSIDRIIHPTEQLSSIERLVEKSASVAPRADVSTGGSAVDDAP